MVNRFSVDERRAQLQRVEWKQNKMAMMAPAMVQRPGQMLRLLLRRRRRPAPHGDNET
jgi:L-ribulose-5-phosphate 3-epimerase UlaE